MNRQGRTRIRHWRGCGLLAGLCLLLAAQVGWPHLAARAAGPGVPSRPFAEQDVLRMVSTIDGSQGAPFYHANATMHQGYLVLPFSRLGSNPSGGFAFFDITDPYRPQRVARAGPDIEGISEQHTIGFTRWEGRDYAALLATHGVQIWDWTDIHDPRQVGAVELPGTSPDYATAAWWLFWQAPFLYVAGASNGIFIVDTSDPANPSLVDRDGQPNPIPISQTGGFRVGPLFAVGNLMVISSNEGAGYATLDISDPRNPVLLAAELAGTPHSYSSLVNGHHLYAAGVDNLFHVFDLRDPSQIRQVGATHMGDRGGYLSLQDGYAHVGASGHYVKIDVRDPANPTPVGKMTSGRPGRDEDFAVVLGNLVVIGDDHGLGSFIMPHQAQPDTAGPAVNMIVPADGAVRQLRTSRIGLTFTDLIDLRTVHPDTFMVRPVGGQPLAGRYSGQMGVVNFTPDAPLEANTVYEVIVPAGGMRDVAGNPTPSTFSASFSTGDSIGANLLCEIETPALVPVGAAVNPRARLVKGGGDVTYAWHFGDGSPVADPSPSPETGYIYRQAGHYTLRAVVSNGVETTYCAALQTIHPPALAGEAPSSSTIILDHSGTQVWTVNPDNDTATAIDAVNLTRMFEVAVGRRPRSLAQAPDGAIWVVNQDDATISVIDQNTGTVAATIDLPYASQPYGILFNPHGQAGYVTLQATGQVVKLDPVGRRVLATARVGATPRGLAMAHDGQRLFVTRHISSGAHGEVVEVDPSVFRAVRVFSLGFDPGPDTESTGRGVPNALGSPAVAPDGRHLWVPSKKDNVARGLLRDGQSLNFESTVRAAMSVIDLAANREDLELRHDFNNRDLAVAVRFSPLGDYAFVALQGANAVEVLDVYTGQLVTSIEEAGRAPQGLVLTSDGSKLFVQSFLTRSVLVYDIKGIIRPGEQRAQLVTEIPTVSAERLSPEVLAGKRIFYNARDTRMGKDSYIACASCHLDDGADGQVWDRTAEGEGLRNTISLAGVGGPEHGRMHWSANFDEVQDFEHDMRGPFGGFGFLTDDEYAWGWRSHPLGDAKAGVDPDLDALAAYVASLTAAPASPQRNGDGSLTADAVQGKALFGALQCGQCHGGAGFTDSAAGLLHDVGTLTAASGQRLGQPLLGLDTPTLRSLWQTAPYLHDGSAATLRDVLTARNPANIHGDLTELQPQELGPLISYLLQIDRLERGSPLPAPAIVVTAPPADVRVAPSSTVRIEAQLAPALQGVQQVEFFVDGELLGVRSESPYAVDWHDTPAGLHFVTARLVTADGLKTTAREVGVRVGD